MNLRADLGLETVRVKGRATRRVTVAEAGELRLSDLKLLEGERSVAAPGITKVRERHHALARCLASGMSEGQAAIACGYVGSRVSILKGDPTFQELVKFYQAEVNERYLGLHELLGALSKDAASELLDRLETDPDGFDHEELMSLLKLGADRTGHGPTSKQEVNHTVNFGARLEAARQRMIDVTPRHPERGAAGPNERDEE